MDKEESNKTCAKNEHDDKVVTFETRGGGTNRRHYPKNRLGFLLCEFARCTTFTVEQMKVLQQLGYKIVAEID